MGIRIKWRPLQIFRVIISIALLTTLQLSRMYHGHTNQMATTANFQESSLTLVSIGPRSDGEGIKASKRSSIKKRKWAYAFLLAGVGENNPYYKGLFYNILVAADHLKGSKADIVLMVQMMSTDENSRLTDEETRLLTALNVKIQYLDPPQSHQSFYSIQFEKFRILNMTEYSRVMYLDSDVWPFCPLDYLFELSDPKTEESKNSSKQQIKPLLKQNIVLAFTLEPASGGLFILEPKEGDYDLVQGLIKRREQEAYNLAKTGNHLFNRTIGWGHQIIPPDRWRSTTNRKSLKHEYLWDWHGDLADQGLLYYWTKYYKQDVSLIIGPEVENWSSRKGEAYLETSYNETTDVLQPYGCVNAKELTTPFYKKAFYKKFVPYRDFKHFSGKSKPWNYEYLSKKSPEASPMAPRWVKHLKGLAKKYGMTSSIKFTDRIITSTFGNFPHRDMVLSSFHSKQTEMQ